MLFRKWPFWCSSSQAVLKVYKCWVLFESSWKYGLESEGTIAIEISLKIIINRVSCNSIIQWVPQLFEQLEFFHVNKSCKTECCSNKMHQIVQNMILTWGLKLKLSLSLRTAISGQHSFFYRWEKAGVPLLPSKYNGSRGSPAFSHL